MDHPSELTVQPGAGQGYPVLFAPIGQLPRLMLERGMRLGKCLIVTDENVGSRYAAMLIEAFQSLGWRPALFTIPPGEESKRLEVLSDVVDWALGLGIDRKTPLVALGGGVVGDLAGFAAAVLLRGIPLVQAPTTLIAQVDSAIGGKTGVNHAAGKNLVGAFHQPELVCADTSLLLSLDRRDWISGLAETVKHALIADEELFAGLREDWDRILAGNLDVAAPIIRRSAAVKVGIVSRDVFESGERALLNFGHTFGHAIEKVTGYGLFTHGEAVAAGMIAAIHLSTQLRPGSDFGDALSLTRSIPVQQSIGEDLLEPLIEAMGSDKKRQAGRLRFVVLDSLGKASVTEAVTEEQVRDAWRSILS